MNARKTPDSTLLPRHLDASDVRPNNQLKHLNARANACADACANLRADIYVDIYADLYER